MLAKRRAEKRALKITVIHRDITVTALACASFLLLKLPRSCHTSLSNSLTPFTHTTNSLFPSTHPLPFFLLLLFSRPPTLYLISPSSSASNLHHSSLPLRFSPLSFCCHALSFLFHLFNISFAIHHHHLLLLLHPRHPVLSSLCTQQADQRGEDWESLEKVRLPLTLNLSQCMLELKQYQQVVELNNKLLKKHKGNIC